MKKVININFQGRVIPIEETAYELLKQYTESLRIYFANEDGRNEILNDIESRIAELFSDRLKKGATCITDDDVNAIIANMGRPEDFEAADADLGSQPQSAYSAQSSQQNNSSSQTGQSTVPPQGFYRRGRFSRNADDKIIGGVCSGLANYLGLDPAIMRIVFVLLFGALFWIYILLWIIVPSESMTSNITKRLYRNPDDKVIAGVCGGLASYFDIQAWIPRLIFALPIVLGIVGGSFNAMFWDWDWSFGPRIISSGLGSTLFIVYVVLWIAVPYASTAAQKLEMKGERIDLNSIRDTVKEDLQGFKSRAQNWGNEVKQTAQQYGSQGMQYGAEFGRSAGNARSGVGNVIGIIFKAFFLFIAAIIALALFGVLMGILFGGMAVFPIKDFFLEGFWQNAFAWLSLLLFLGVPIIALITWLVRRIMGVRSQNRYLGYTFSSLWFIGLLCTIFLFSAFFRNFKNRAGVEEQIAITQPANNKLYIESVGATTHYYSDDAFFDWDGDAPFYGLSHDSVMMKNVRVNVVKSKDSLYHLYSVRFSRSNTNSKAKELAQRINFPVTQKDSLIELPRGFAITSKDKFRNQQVMIVVEVPIGKKIQLDRSLEEFDWFNINANRRRGFNVEWDNDDWGNSLGWTSNVEYVMTRDGLTRTNDLDPVELKEGRFKFKIKDNGVQIEGEGTINTDSTQFKKHKGKTKPADEKEDETVSLRPHSGSVSTDVSPLLMLGSYL